MFWFSNFSSAIWWSDCVHEIKEENLNVFVLGFVNLHFESKKMDRSPLCGICVVMEKF